MNIRFQPCQLRLAKCFGAPLLALAATATVTLVLAPPAAAQMTVFDPTNYSQNLLSAARALSQVNNQIKSLQNEATMLTGLAKNLSRIDFPQLQQLNQTLRQIDQLMGQARGIDFKVDGLDAQLQRLFPQGFNRALTSNQRVVESRTRLDTAMAAYRQTIAVQAQVVENVQSDAQALSAIVGRSQGAEGALQAQQATNQLLALAAKQQFQIQNLMAAQYRAEAIEQARRVHAEAEARAATTRFLGSGSAYSKLPPGQ